MKQRQNTHAWSLAGEEVVAYSLAGGKAAAVTRERGEVATCSLVREGRRRQSLVVGPGQRENFETVANQKQLPSAGLDSMGGACAQRYHVSTNY